MFGEWLSLFRLRHIDLSKSLLHHPQWHTGQTIRSLFHALYRTCWVGGWFRGAAIDTFVNGDGTSGDGVVWFGYDGAPQTRDADGTVPLPFAEDAVVTFAGGQVITVHMYTGMVE